VVRSFKILVVDDFEPFHEVISQILAERNDFCVSYASDGLEAVRRTRKLRPQLVLLDIGLPKLNGIQVAKRIRRVSPASKILFCTQESSSEVVAEALLIGGDGYLLKSNIVDELLQAIDTVLEGGTFVSKFRRM
jgi:DNA-binding NarL/FixJ family response regulator